MKSENGVIPELCTIEKCVQGGMGLARTSRGIVFVNGVLPDEVVSVRVAGTQGGLALMEPVAFVKESPFRRVAPCLHFGVCGGCDWLFIDYPQQCLYKKAIFIEAMQRIGKIAAFPEPQVVAAAEFGYRRRAQIKIDEGKNVGFYRRASNEVVPVEQCPLLSDRLNVLLGEIAGNCARIPGDIRSCKVVDGDSGVASDPVIAGLTTAATTITCGSMSFDIGGADFVQSNRYLLEPLATWVAEHCCGATLVDLYGGAGFFSMMLADRCTKGWLVETDRAMAERAAVNFKRQNILHIAPVAAQAEKMEKYIPRGVDVMVVDPPRPGLTRQVREAVVRIQPKRIIYVSCNCATQARDAGFFLKEGGYTISASALIDLYPNTHHTETVLVLDKR